MDFHSRSAFFIVPRDIIRRYGILSFGDRVLTCGLKLVGGHVKHGLSRRLQFDGEKAPFSALNFRARTRIFIAVLNVIPNPEAMRAVSSRTSSSSRIVLVARSVGSFSHDYFSNSRDCNTNEAVCVLSLLKIQSGV